MTSKKFLLILSIGVLLSGCATVGSYQSQCEKQNAAFADVVTCLKTALAADWRPAMSTDAKVKLYLLKADQLSQMVQKGEISELDARVKLQELYVHLKQIEDTEEMATRPIRTECHESLGSIRCTSR